MTAPNDVRAGARPSPAPAAGEPAAAPGTRPWLRVARILARVLLALLALAVFASPFAYTFAVHYREQWFGPQVSVPAARMTAAELTRFREAAAAAAHVPAQQPIILAYHDVAWHSTSQYVVTPAEFAAQMAMLHAAGYHALTARQIVRYVRGGSVPARSVAITFDDGTRGLWTYTDEVLRRYHLHGIAFLITGRVGTHQPYYLTWQEIRRMHSSGTWDFESHTNDLHQKVPVAPGRLGDPLTQRIWLPRQHRLESMMAFRTRVQEDLLQSVSDIKGDHLPRPVLFAYPFSDSLGARPYTASEYSNRIVHKLFAVAMTNYVDPPVPVSRREASTGLLSRLEVTSADTAGTLFTRLRQTSSLPAGDARSFDDPARWQGPDGDRPGIAVRARAVTLRNRHGDWDYAAYAPGATADWDNYEISAVVAGLNYRSNPSATISVRVGSPAQLNVSVANHYLQVRWGSVRNRAVALARHLRASLSHRVTVRVFRDTTVVLVDGRVVMSGTCAGQPPCASPATSGRPGTGGVASTGGFALSGFRPDRFRPFAHFGHVTVRRLTR